MKIGIQLFSTIDKVMTEEGLLSTLDALAEMGYDGVEFLKYGAYGEMPAAMLKEKLNKRKLTGIGVHLHLPLDDWFCDKLEPHLAYAAEVGLKYIIMPYIFPEQQNEDAYYRIIEGMPGIIDRCRKYGLEFVYHNHNFEFEKLGDSIVLKAFANADSKVELELDTFWCFFTGNDPKKMMDELGNKLKLIHVKDYQELAPFGEMKFTAIGTGIMDNASVVKKAQDRGLEWVIVEQDNSKIDTLESAKISLEGLRKLV